MSWDAAPSVDLSQFFVSAGMDRDEVSADLECDRRGCYWQMPIPQDLAAMVEAARRHEAEAHGEVSNGCAARHGDACEGGCDRP